MQLAPDLTTRYNPPHQVKITNLSAVRAGLQRCHLDKSLVRRCKPDRGDSTVSNLMPFETHIDLITGHMSACERHFTRRVSDMAGYFEANLDDLAGDGSDPLIYEYYEREVPAESGHIVQDTTVIYPGTIDGEYYMTKGHFHANARSAEVYLCLRGRGYLLMQTKNGENDMREYRPGTSIYVPPGWAHRSINTGNEPLVFLALYPADSGHDYGSIAEEGFWVRLFRGPDGQPMIIPRSLAR
jgi:glucose-6-phosphate isomerase